MKRDSRLWRETRARRRGTLFGALVQACESEELRREAMNALDARAWDRRGFRLVGDGGRARVGRRAETARPPSEGCRSIAIYSIACAGCLGWRPRDSRATPCPAPCARTLA